MGQKVRERCHGITLRRGAKTRCKHTSLTSIYCWQHLKKNEGFRIKKVHGALGLVTTKPIEKGENVASYTPPLKLAQWAKPSIRANTKVIRKGKVLRAIKDIAANHEVTTPFDLSAKPKPIIKPKPIVKKRKLIKPDHGPEPPELVFRAEPERAPKPKPKIKRKARSPADKHEIFHLKRILALQDLYNDKNLAHELRIPVSHRVINVPPRGSQLFNYALEKLLKKEIQSWVDHVNQNPRNRMTVSKANSIIEKIVKKTH